jgi:hypothetical protein
MYLLETSYSPRKETVYNREHCLQVHGIYTIYILYIGRSMYLLETSYSPRKETVYNREHCLQVHGIVPNFIID